MKTNAILPDHAQNTESQTTTHTINVSLSLQQLDSDKDHMYNTHNKNYTYGHELKQNLKKHHKSYIYKYQ